MQDFPKLISQPIAHFIRSYARCARISLSYHLASLGDPAVGRLGEAADAVLDLVAVGRGLIADPEWPRKVQEGRVEEIVQCVHCNAKCHGNFSKGIPIECAQW